MEFIAYRLYDVPEFVIEPADLKRDWMDATPHQFAYRCLPLVMANQAGWVLRCPFEFEVVWNGDPIPLQGLDIRYAPEDERLSGFVRDHFGDGILTFSLPFLFRTPPGYGLLVRGATNFWVPNAHPLDGLVETDWLESTFTMNWKIVEPDRPARFRKGDPICMVMPYPLDLLEAMRPRVVPIEEAPEVKAAFERWTESRSRFIDDPDRQPEQWQKDYFQGKTAQGNRAPAHRTRFRLKPFEPS